MQRVKVEGERKSKPSKTKNKQTNKPGNKAIISVFVTASAFNDERDKPFGPFTQK